MLLLSKSRAPRLSSVLYILHDRLRHELYANLHGDKETFWLACELAGGIACGLSGWAAGEMGRKKRLGLLWAPSTRLALRAEGSQVGSFNSESSAGRLVSSKCIGGHSDDTYGASPCTYRDFDFQWRA